MWVEYPQQLEASLEAEYPRFDVLGAWLTGEITSRKFLTLVYGLSNDSWFKQALHQDLREIAAEEEHSAVVASRSMVKALLTGQAKLAAPGDMTVEKRSPIRNEV